MAEFQEVMKQFNRMCKDKDCMRCKISICYPECKNYLYKYPQQAEKNIMKWAEEHPVQTNADKFREVFGVDVNTGGCGSIGVLTTEKKCAGADCKKCKYNGFWNQEYKEPKGE